MIESIPLAISGLQAALSPSLGALATPVLWQAMQADLYSFSPAGCPVALLAPATATVFAAGAAAACFLTLASSIAALSWLMGPGALLCFINSSFHFTSTTTSLSRPRLHPPSQTWFK